MKVKTRKEFELKVKDTANLAGLKLSDSQFQEIMEMYGNVEDIPLQEVVENIMEIVNQSK